MKYFFSLLLLSVFTNAFVFAQTPGLKLSRSFGGSSSDIGYEVQNTPDGGFLTVSEIYAAGFDVTTFHGAFSPDLWVVKMNAQGGIEWQKTLGGSGEDRFRKMIYNADGSVIIFANTTSSNGDITNFKGSQDIWVVKLDAKGNLLWQKSMGGSNKEEFRYCDRSSDNGYIITGYTNSNNGDVSGNHGGSDFWVFKLSSDGNLEWQKCLGGSGLDIPTFIMSAPDDNIILLGYTTSNNGDITNQHGNNDLWVIKLNATGNLIWQKTYGGSNSDIGFKAMFSQSGTITVLANTASNDGDVIGHKGVADLWVVDLNYTTGLINWQKCIGGTATELPISILRDAQGMSLIVSTSMSVDGDASTNHGGGDIFLSRLTPTGSVLWSKCFGGSGRENLYHIIEDTAAQNFVLAASTESPDGDVSGYHLPKEFNDTISDAWLIGIDYNGQLKWQRTLGGSEIDYLTSIKQIKQNEYVLVGVTGQLNGDLNNVHGFEDSWLVLFGPVNTIKGTVFIDNNSNGLKESNEPFYTNAQVTSSKPNSSKKSLTINGFFINEVDTGTYTTSLEIKEPYFNIIPIARNSNFSNYFQTDSFSFALQPIPNKKDLVINAIPLTAARPGFNTSYKIFYKNAGTTVIPSGEIIFKKESRLAFVSSTPAINSSNNDTLKWSYSNFNPGDTASITINLKVQAPPSVNNGDTLTSIAIITPVSGDETPKDDTAVVKHRVTGSFDPNDKYENHGGIIRPQHITNNDYLNYTIRFQNTGTDVAFTVVVRDTLDTKVDWNSLQMIAASHAFNLSIEDGNKLTWTFPNINLPDSNKNEPSSHGFISYRIKPKSTVAIGDTIHNTASIYFDYNLPVKTNNAFSTVQQNIILPLKLLSFSGNYFNGETILKWTTQGEYDFKEFIIERSANGRDYKTVGKKNGANEINSIASYQFNDNLSSINGVEFYYRLKMIDKGGTFSYSPVIALHRNGNAESLIFYPNPVLNAKAIISITSESIYNAEMKVFDAAGKMVWRKAQVINKGANAILLPEVTQFAAGVYTLQLKGDKKVMTKQFAIVK